MPGTQQIVSFQLLDVPIHVETPSEEAAGRLEVCYAAVAGSRPGEPPLHAELKYEGDSWRVVVETRGTQTVSLLVDAVRILNHELLHAVMVRSRSLLFVHAAVVAVDGRGVVLPGISRAGKSTLALALVLNGARFLSDEMLAWNPGSGEIFAVPRAFKVRDVCLDYFPTLAGRFVGEGEGRFLPFGELAPDVLQDRVRPECVVVPTWNAAGDDQLRPITRGQTLLRLTSCTMNFGSHREAGIDLLAELAGGVSGYEVQWTDPHATAAGIFEAVRS